MGLGGCYSIMKFLVFFLNLIFWICGLCIIVISTWMLTDPTFYVSLAQDESSYYSATYLLLAVGILLFAVGFIGCCATLYHSQPLLALFFCVLLIILVAEVSAAAWAYANSDKLEALVVDSVKTTVKKEYSVISSRTETFDSIQSGLECCGGDGPSDWSQSKFNGVDEESYEFRASTKANAFKLPESCCLPNTSESECKQALTVTGIGASISPLIHQQGCTVKLLGVLNSYAKTFIGIWVAIGLAQLLGLIFSLILCCALQQNSYKS